jgi:succinyl-diaminopimelate desuccinylase
MAPDRFTTLTSMEERALAEKLIGYDSSREDGIRLCAGFIKGWLEAREIPASQLEIRGLPILVAEVGAQDGPVIVLHGHLDVVPGLEDQFQARVEGDRLIGRGAYDMKGALAAMMLALNDLKAQSAVGVRLAVVPDEEAEDEDYRGSDKLVDSGLGGSFAITGEPTDLHVGVAAKGVLAVRLEIGGRAAHGSTPWEGDNAVLKAFDVFRRIEALPFSRQSSELFDRPSINLGRIWGGDALNKVPDTCVIDVDIRYLPEQDDEQILAAIGELPDTRVISTFRRPPVQVDRESGFVKALCAATSRYHEGEVAGVGRDGASDAISFLRVGVPAVEFGPVGGGHHGPEEWVSIESLRIYRRALSDFVAALPADLLTRGSRAATAESGA